jgi:hypothetical protein
VSEPRAVLKEFGVELPPTVRIQVPSFTAIGAYQMTWFCTQKLGVAGGWAPQGGALPPGALLAWPHGSHSVMTPPGPHICPD